VTLSGDGAPGLRSALVTVGEELLLGRTVDTNAAWVSGRLADLGAPVIRRFTVGDEDTAIAEALRRALDCAEIVVTSGGLGPTSDDRTREAVAGSLGRRLLLDRELLARLEERFRHRGYDELPPANRSQAEVPEGSTALPNPVGTAPGLVLTQEGRMVILLPGVPRELQALFHAVEDRIRDAFGPRLRPVRIRTLHTTGIPESVLAPRVEKAMEGVSDIEVAFLPDLEGVDVRFTARDRDEDTAEAALDAAEERLAPVLGEYRVPGSGDVAREVVEVLTRRGWTLGLGESCTGGLVARRITDVPGASTVLLGGVVAYANPAKVRYLGVPEEVLAERGAVSAEVARAMASGAARAFEADCGVGITGVAGPGGGTPDKPVGTVHVAASVGGRVQTEAWRFSGDREAVRIRSAQAALTLLLRMIQEAE
jgi:nicotinamide-nucleotide amidase